MPPAINFVNVFAFEVISAEFYRRQTNDAGGVASVAPSRSPNRRGWVNDTYSPRDLASTIGSY
jgi:hypothetical protein